MRRRSSCGALFVGLALASPARVASAQRSAEASFAVAELRERQGDHDGAARAYLALLTARGALDSAALAGRAEHIVALVRAARSDREGFAACEQIASRIESDRRRAHAALSLRLTCAESELATLAERRRAQGPVGPELYAIERESRALDERLLGLQSDARTLRLPVESVLATALVGCASGLLGDESAAMRSAVEATRAWAEMVDVPALLVALPGQARATLSQRANRQSVAPAPVLTGRARGPSDRERALRASAGDALVERTWSAVVELVWVSIERDRRAVTSQRIEPLARAATDLRRERWFSGTVGPALDRHRALLEPSMLARYEALWSADATSARFAAALRVGELFLDYGERNRAVQDALIAASPMAEALRGYVSPADRAYLQRARTVFERCVSEAQRAGVENEWVRACGQRLREIGSSGVVIDELVPSVSARAQRG
ncbi:MAG: hypothetical protein U0269_32055 [Polyangiales bacterium]